MNEDEWKLTRGGNPVIPAPCRVQFPVKFEHAVSDGVSMMVVEEKPTVEGVGAELLLNLS